MPMAVLGLRRRDSREREENGVDAGEVWVWWQRMEGLSYFLPGKEGIVT